MFIIICQDVIEKAINNEDSDHEDAVAVLKGALCAVRWNKHIVHAPDMRNEDIDNLRNVLAKEEQNLLGTIHKNRINSELLIKSISVIAKVTFEKQTKKGNGILYVNPKTHKDFELHEETHFIVENILDTEFYEPVIKNYFIKKINKDRHLFSINLYCVHGGGGTIGEVINREIELAQHFCFVIGDSDKKHETSEEGCTAQNIRKAVENRTPFNLDFYIMSKVREIENLIPFCLLSKFSDRQHQVFLANYQNTNNLSFYDMKAGIDYKMLYGTHYDEYKKKFPDLFQWEEIDDVKNNAKTIEEFNEEAKKICKINYNWSRTILKKIIDLAKEDSELYKIEESDLTPNQKEEWDEIGKLVFSWCCCFANPPR